MISGGEKMVYLTDSLTNEATTRLFKPKILNENKMATPEEVQDRLAKAREPIKKMEDTEEKPEEEKKDEETQTAETSDEEKKE